MCLSANYFAKCATNSFRNMNAIGITWLISYPLLVREANYLQWDSGTYMEAIRDRPPYQSLLPP